MAATWSWRRSPSSRIICAGVDIFDLELGPPCKAFCLLGIAAKSFRGDAIDTQLDMLREVSPLFHADKITKPLIVLQGANDPRVIKPESDEIVEAIKKKNGVVEYVVFENEGHGWTKKANEIRGNKAILDFLDKHLKATTTAAAGKN